MELIRRHLATQPSGYAAYLSLQRALMRRHIARGGTPEDFCNRLSRVYRARYGDVALRDSEALHLTAVHRAVESVIPEQSEETLQQAA